MNRRELLIGMLAVVAAPAALAAKGLKYTPRLIVPILILDGTVDKDGDVFDYYKTNLRFNTAVPVYYVGAMEARTIVGWARLSLVLGAVDTGDGGYEPKRTLFAEFDIPELDKYKYLVPSVTGRVYRRQGRLIVDAEVFAVDLSFRSNADTRIKSLEKYV